MNREVPKEHLQGFTAQRWGKFHLPFDRKRRLCYHVTNDAERKMVNMATKEKLSREVRTYENEEIRVTWNPEACVHAGACVRGNSRVFDPARCPWIDLTQAPAKEIASVIGNCPSGALRVEMKNPVRIVFEEEACRSAAYRDDVQIGECEFLISGNRWTLTHTGVRPGFEGQGIARMLVEKVIEEARRRKAHIVPVCSYARKMMLGREAYRDVLAP